MRGNQDENGKERSASCVHSIDRLKKLGASSTLRRERVCSEFVLCVCVCVCVCVCIEAKGKKKLLER